MNIQEKNETVRNMNYQGMMITYDEDQTVSNCITLGFSTEKTKDILVKMRGMGFAYLSKNRLENYR